MFSEQCSSNFFLLVRSIPNTSYKFFLDNTRDPQELANKYFDAKENECSVYHASNTQDESEIVAAHYLTLKRNYIEKVVSARILKGTIERIGLGIKESPGGTGIIHIDQKHHDITGKTELFCEILKQIKLCALDGKDVFRVHEPPILANWLRKFLYFSDEKITITARTRCTEALSSYQTV